MKLWLLVLLLAFIASPAHAEPVVLSFTDPANCPPCKVLENSWQKSKPPVHRYVLDVRVLDRSKLIQWGVTQWPTSFLIEMDGPKCVKVYRRHVGSMTPAELLKFCEVPK